MGGPVGLILSFADPVELAKTVTGMRELGEKFKVRGGVLDGKPLSAEEIQALAALPPREVVLAQLLGLLHGAGDPGGAAAQRAGLGAGAVGRRDRQKERRRGAACGGPKRCGADRCGAACGGPK